MRNRRGPAGVAWPAAPPDEAAERTDEAASVRAALARLTDRHRRLLALRYGLEDGPDTLDAIAGEFGVTQQAVWQAEGAALRKLAAALTPAG